MANINGRYVHEWYAPIVLKVYHVDENVYYGPWYDPKQLPVTEFDNCLAMPYEHVMPRMKWELLKGRSGKGRNY